MDKIMTFRVWDKKRKFMFYAGSLSSVGDFYRTQYNDKVTNYDEGEEFYEKFITDYDWMPSVGMTDKFGRNIYEGDFVKIQDEIFEVMWLSYGWELFNFKTNKTHHLNDVIKYQCEVVGNKYEKGTIRIF